MTTIHPLGAETASTFPAGTEAPSTAPVGTAPAGALTCPSCHSTNVRRSRRRRRDALLRRSLYRSYRCRHCRARFWRFDSTALAVLAIGVTVAAGVVGGGWALILNFDDSPEVPVLAAPTVRPTPPSSIRPGTSAAERLKAPVPAADASLTQRAEQGDARAQLGLALAYLNGQGVEKNPALAAQWCQKAAQQGHLEAQYTLASLYSTGQGVLQNFPAAYRWFEKAAQQNHAESQYQLGLLNRSGQGTGFDKNRAYVWFSLAATQGHERAAAERDRLLPTMTKDQVAAAQAEAQAWRPTPAKP